MSTALAPYRSPEERDLFLEELAARVGGELQTIGCSVQQRPLTAVRVPARGIAQAPRVVMIANIHGLEWISSEVAMGLLAAMGDGAVGSRLRGQAELWVVPVANPDGYARTWEQAGQGRVRELRPNARGVDLNRNFPLPAGASRGFFPGAGSTRPGAATYVGPAPLSEPESAAIDTLLARIRPQALISGHSFMGMLIPARVKDGLSFAGYRGLHQAVAKAQPRAPYGLLHSRYFDTFTGELEDWAHHNYGCWSACLESFPIAASFGQQLWAERLFWRFNPRDPQPWVENDVPAVLAFFEAALALGPPTV